MQTKKKNKKRKKNDDRLRAAYIGGISRILAQVFAVVLSVGLALYISVRRMDKEPPKETNTNWLPWVLVILGVILLMAALWFSYRSLKRRLAQQEMGEILRSLPILGSVIAVFFNARIVKAYLERVHNLRREGADQMTGDKPTDRMNLSITGIMIGRKARQNTYAYIFLLLALAVYIGIWFVLNRELLPEVAILILALILGLYINQAVLGYRVRRGIYGTSEYEVREILAFILSHAEKSNLSGGPRLRGLRVFPALDQEYSRAEESDEVRGAEGAEA